MIADRAVMNAMRMRYNEAHRHYHDWSHIESLLKLKDFARDRLFNQQAIDIAILFHDAIYEPGEPDNKARSADLMAAMLDRLIAPVTLAAAREMVLASAHHQLPDHLLDPVRSDCAHFLDMDLAVFGGDRDVFDAFEEAIRDEYADLDDKAYALGRAAALQKLLDRQSIFLTPLFGREFEKPARRNIARRLAELD
jgi:predicted metal-dependent HD superfamily phosphohydrolase